MILKYARIYSEGFIRKGILLIKNQLISKIIFNPSNEDILELTKKNENQSVIDCRDKLILPGVIDIHSHLRDMGQSEKETFQSGTKSAAFSGITSVFTMPNTVPPAITANQIEKWMNQAKNNIFIDVGFISGVPEGINEEEIKKVIDLGVFGFKIYPHAPLSGIDWTNPINFQILLKISSKYQIPLFIHPHWPNSTRKSKQLYENYLEKGYDLLEIHNMLYSIESEKNYVLFVIDNYNKYLYDKKRPPEKYPIIHFCHISCMESFKLIQEALNSNDNLKISFEVTPHHLFLTNKIKLKNDNFGKVIPPLRDEKHPNFLFKQLSNGKISIIGTDHAPHTIEEKSQKFYDAPSGFPGFETYLLLLLDKVSKYEFSLDKFVRIASENPSKAFNLKKKGFIREGYDADLVIVENVPKYPIKSKSFKTKAKYSPFENFETTIKIWKVFLRGFEINLEDSEPRGRILKKTI